MLTAADVSADIFNPTNMVHVPVGHNDFLDCSIKLV